MENPKIKYPFPKLKKGKLKMYILENSIKDRFVFNLNQQILFRHY